MVGPTSKRYSCCLGFCFVYYLVTDLLIILTLNYLFTTVAYWLRIRSVSLGEIRTIALGLDSAGFSLARSSSTPGFDSIRFVYYSLTYFLTYNTKVTYITYLLPSNRLGLCLVAFERLARNRLGWLQFGSIWVFGSTLRFDFLCALLIFMI